MKSLPVNLKPWFLASRPKTLTAGVMPVVVGTALASSVLRAVDVSIHWHLSLCALACAILIQIGTNLINDAKDYENGVDTSERIGPLRVTQSGLLSSVQVMAGGLICFVLATLISIPLVIAGGWPIVILGVMSLLCGYGYTGGPFPLAYAGVGDIFVIFFFGLAAVSGVFFLQTGRLSLPAALAGLQLGFLSTVLIAVNNLRDVESDRISDKKTLAVRFGLTFARFEITLLALLPIVLQADFALITGQRSLALPLLSLPIALLLIINIWRTPPSRYYNRFLAQAAMLHLVFGILLSASYLV